MDNIVNNDFQRKIDRFYESLKKIDSIIFIRRTVDLNSYKTCCKEFDEIKNLNFNNEEKTLKMRLNKIFQEYNIKIKILNNWNEINNYLIHRY